MDRTGIASFFVAIAHLSTACSTPSRQTAPALQHIDQPALKRMVDTTAHELLIPGVMVLLRTPQGQYEVTYGTTLLGANRSPSKDTHFRIASNTKTMTAAVIVQLAQENKLGIGDPVSKYVSGVPNGDKITIADLLKMRSGLYNYTNDPKIATSLDQYPAKAWSPAEVLAIAFAHPTSFPPGTAFEYVNTNYALLGLIAEKAGRRPLARLMQERLFGPLHMQHTSLPAAVVNAIPDPYSHGYLYGSSSVAMVGKPPYSPEVQAAARDGSLLPKDYTNVNHSFAEAAGGVISTAGDMATWIEALVSGRVFSDAYQRRWLDSLEPEDASKPDGSQYGYGISKLSWGPNSVYFHGGETAGYNSFIGYDPNSQMTLVVWTNLTVSLDGKPTANSIMLKVLDQIYVVSPLAASPPSAARR